MRVKGNGNVGIGTNNPQYKLDVAGDFRTTSNASVQGSVQVAGGVIANTVQVARRKPCGGQSADGYERERECNMAGALRRTRRFQSVIYQQPWPAKQPYAVG